MLKLKKVFAVLITLAVIVSVVASMAYATSGDSFGHFDFVIGIPNWYSYTDPMKQDHNNPVKFFPMESTSDDTFVYVDVKFVATSGMTNTSGDNVTPSEDGALVPYRTCQVGYIYQFELMRNTYFNVYLGVASDSYSPQTYTVSGIWGYGTI